jgi:tRNA dimethylallyltransferase
VRPDIVAASRCMLTELTPPDRQSSHVALVGPTGSGKSDVAMAFARHRPDVEIVAVDALQVYRGLDIGTGTPSAADRAAVLHHGLDLVSPAEEFTVAEFAAEFARVERDAAARHAQLLVVGGTGLYLRTVLDRVQLPGQWPELRRRLEDELAAVGPAVLHARLAELDPVAADRIEPGNGRRTVRALEVTVGSGRPFSSFGPGLTTYPPSPHRMLGLLWPRPALAARIERRVRSMIAAGWVDEVAGLLEGAPLSRTASVALGYEELIEHVRGQCSLDDAVERIITRTRSYAVRQERWFRRDPRIRWVPIEHDPVAEALPVLETM